MFELKQREEGLLWLAISILAGAGAKQVDMDRQGLQGARNLKQWLIEKTRSNNSCEERLRALKDRTERSAAAGKGPSDMHYLHPIILACVLLMPLRSQASVDTVNILLFDHASVC